MAEASLFVLQRIENDRLNGETIRYVKGAGFTDRVNLDFQSYLVEYWLCVDILPRFIKHFGKSLEAPPAPPPDPNLFVFGG